MRGKAEGNWIVCADHGITPAYAGKRILDKFVHHLRGDHPRVCGEKMRSVRLSTK